MNLFMQNEPNFGNDKMNIRYVTTEGYEDLRLFKGDENEPKTNPHEPNFLRNSAFVSYGIKEGYETNPRFWPKIPKPKTKPICRMPKMNVSYVNTEGYEDLRLFSRDENKPKTKPIFADFRENFKLWRNKVASRKFCRLACAFSF